MNSLVSEAPPSVWNSLYERQSNPWRSSGLTTTTRRLLSSYAVGQRFLEVGCGTGEDAVDIAAMGFEYCGLDVAEAAIFDAKTKNRSNNSQFACADFFKWHAEQSFDVIYEKGFFHGLAGLRRRSNFIRRIATQLAPDGVWISVCGAADQKHTRFPHGAIYLRDLIMPAEVYFEVLEVVKDNYGLADQEREFRAWHSVFRRY